ncbi:MAG: peptidylprolyl isomerase [Victivallales bacterium]|nr:peptidylprolyl isomerase [Victivallales bacterium]
MRKYVLLIFLSVVLFGPLCRTQLFATAGNFKGITGGSNVEHIGILATVNGEPITLLDVLKICSYEEARLPYMYQGRKLDVEVKKLRMAALEKVIENKLVYTYFKSRKFDLPKNYIQMYLDKIAESYNVNDQKSLKEMLESKGRNYEEFKKEAYQNAAVNAIVGEMCYRNIYVTPREVYKYYKKNRENFVTPDQIKVQVLKLKKDGMHKKNLDTLADSLAATFREGDKQSFNDAVLMYSEGPEVKNEGNIGWIDKNKIRDDFADSVTKHQVGDIIGPIKTTKAYYFLRLDDKKDKIVQSFTDAKKRIRKKLLQQKKEKKYTEFINSLRKKASIKYFVN